MHSPVRHGSLTIPIAAALLLIGCTDKTETKQAPKIRAVKLRQEWTANANFAGAVLASDIFARDHHIDLKVEEGAETVDPVKLLIAGDTQFADVAADRVLVAISKGADLVIVGVVNPTSPTVFLAKRDKQIITPRDFEGHTVGLLTGTATEYVYRALLEATHVNRKRIKEVEIGFDLPPFIAGAYDVRPAFDYDEPVSLDAKNILYSRIDPREYGVHFVGTVYVTSRKFLSANHELVQDVVSALADGWRLALKEPDRAIAAIKKHHSAIDEKRELTSLKRAMDYIKPRSGRVLQASPDDWTGTITALQKLGVIKQMPIESFLDETFIQQYYASEGRETKEPR